jgi:hypothetical protein
MSRSGPSATDFAGAARPYRRDRQWAAKDALPLREEIYTRPISLISKSQNFSRSAVRLSSKLLPATKTKDANGQAVSRQDSRSTLRSDGQRSPCERCRSSSVGSKTGAVPSPPPLSMLSSKAQPFRRCWLQPVVAPAVTLRGAPLTTRCRGTVPSMRAGQRTARAGSHASTLPCRTQ